MKDNESRHSSFDMVKPEVRDLAESCVGQNNPESFLGQHLIATAYMFYMIGEISPEKLREWAGEAAGFEERAWRRSSPNFPFRTLYLKEAIRLYSLAENKTKVSELVEVHKNS